MKVKKLWSCKNLDLNVPVENSVTELAFDPGFTIKTPDRSSLYIVTKIETVYYRLTLNGK